jgi:transcriptional regulator with XRE-family HTH domain
MPCDAAERMEIRGKEERQALGLELSAKLAAIIEAERDKRGWTQEDLALRLEMQQSGIATWEKGSLKFGALQVFNIMALEDVFGLPRGNISYRLGATGEDRPDFETFIKGCKELDEARQDLLRDTYRFLLLGLDRDPGQ